MGWVSRSHLRSFTAAFALVAYTIRGLTIIIIVITITIIILIITNFTFFIIFELHETNAQITTHII